MRRVALVGLACVGWMAAGVGAAQAAAAQAAAAGGSAVLAEGNYTANDQGVRHVATLAGYVCYGLMALVVCFGVLTTTGWARRLVARATLTSTHMVLAVSTLSFGAIHAVAYVLQTGQHFSILNTVVPMIGGGELEVAFGIVGLELGLAVSISIWVQRRLGYRRWHLLHWLAYPAFALSLLHVITTSSEVQALGLLGLFVLAIAAAPALLLVLRMLPAPATVAARITPQEV